jgi:hypothetical protein
MNGTEVQIRAESRGAYWVAWLDADGKGPLESVVLVGQTEEEARKRAEEYRDRRARPEPAPAG